MARLISTIIKRAYESPRLSVLHPRAHEVRALSASLALVHNLPLEVILDSATWRSQNTFINQYLRDITRLREDGTYGIASVVVSQRAASALHNSAN